MKLLMLALCLAVATAKDTHYANRWLDNCKDIAVPRDFNIVGGEEADPNEFPFMVALLRATGSQFCGGSIINENWVMTAAHCVDGTNPSAISILAGEHHLVDESGLEQERDVITIIEHPDYDRRTLNNDIALLELATSLDFGDFVGPVCSPDPTNDYAGETATVSGWGNTQVRPFYPDELQKVDVPVISNEECLGDYPGDITDEMICAGDRDNTDSCQGDSGGPMFIDSADCFVQIGIVSWGIGCAAGYPGVYARVGEFVDWVADNTY